MRTEQQILRRLIKMLVKAVHGGKIFENHNGEDVI
jgi:hypothetical protein